MARNPIPKVAIGWGIAALHGRVDDLKKEVNALQTLIYDDDLSEKIAPAYHAIEDVIHMLESSLSQLKDAAEQGGVPFDDPWHQPLAIVLESNGLIHRYTQRSE